MQDNFEQFMDIRQIFAIGLLINILLIKESTRASLRIPERRCNLLPKTYV